MDRIRERFEQSGISPDVTFIEGKDPAEGIVERIRKNTDVDILIMGSRGLSGLRRIILGSTSTEVLKKVEIPILIYKDGVRE
jgi:nucleotide-binding universal stress UspA family protein